MLTVTRRLHAAPLDVAVNRTNIRVGVIGISLLRLEKVQVLSRPCGSTHELALLLWSSLLDAVSLTIPGTIEAFLHIHYVEDHTAQGRHA